MSRTMRAARMHTIGEPLQVDEVEVPTPGPTDVLVEVKACGIVPEPRQRAVELRRAGSPTCTCPSCRRSSASTPPASWWRRARRCTASRSASGCTSTRPATAAAAATAGPARRRRASCYAFNGYFGFSPEAQRTVRGLPVRRAGRVHDRAAVQPGRRCRTTSPSRRPRAGATSAPATARCAAPASARQKSCWSTGSAAPSGWASRCSRWRSARARSWGPAGTAPAGAGRKRSPRPIERPFPRRRASRSATGTRRYPRRGRRRRHRRARPRRPAGVDAGRARRRCAAAARTSTSARSPATSRSHLHELMDNDKSHHRLGVVHHRRRPGDGRHGRDRAGRPVGLRARGVQARATSTPPSRCSRTATADSATT